MAYQVIKTINGNQYRYLQRSYREGGKVRTESIYLGPVKPKRGIGSLVGDVAESAKQAAMIRHIWQIDPTPEQLAAMERDRAAQDHINGLLDPSHHITLDELQEVIEYQHREIAPTLLEFKTEPDVWPTPLEPPLDAVPETETATPSEQSTSDVPETERSSVRLAGLDE